MSVKQQRVFETLVMPGDRAVEITESIGRINLDDLRGELEATGGQVVWLGVVAAQARRRANATKVALDVQLAALDKMTRNRMAANGEKPTEAAVTASIRLDPAYLSVYEVHHEALYAAEVAESAKYACVQKMKNLESLAGLLVQEELARRGPSPAILPSRPKRQPV